MYEQDLVLNNLQGLICYHSLLNLLKDSENYFSLNKLLPCQILISGEVPFLRIKCSGSNFKMCSLVLVTPTQDILLCSFQLSYVYG